MNKIILFILLLFLIINNTFAQVSSCPNLDFESGTFLGWQGETGVCCPINTSLSGIISGRHTIMTGSGTDPNTCDVVTYVAPGGVYSARLGNDHTGAEAEKLSYTLTVSPSNSLFVYKYAVVLQDPDHSQSEQPRFQISIINASGTLIDPICGQYLVVSGLNIPGFQTCNGDIRYKDWTTVGLDLTAYIGQTITIEFATGDCSLGAHFGYAYIDAFCAPLQINSTYCLGTANAVLNAPIGFTYLWDTGETTQSITINNPIEGQTHSCLLTSVTGCTVEIATSISLVQPNAEFNITNTCFTNAVFANTTSLPSGISLDSFLWDFGDGSTSFLENPTHSFSASGTYNVTFTGSNSLGCSSTITKLTTVYLEPTAILNYANAEYCNSITTPQSVNLSGTDAYLGGTFSSTAGLTIDATTGSVTPSTSTPGSYVVAYQIPTINNCTVPPVTTNVIITPLPTATLNYVNSPYCNSITTPQSVNLSGTGAYSGGAFSSTEGLTIDAITGSITPSTSTPGSYVVAYQIPTTSGCTVAPVTTNVIITPLPTATLNYVNSPYCNSITTPQSVNLSGSGAYSGGTFSSTAGLTIDATTGNITPSTSIPGSYVVAYLIPTTSGCAVPPVTTNVIITPLPTATFNYVNSPYCNSITTPQTVNLSGTGAYSGGTFSSTAGLTIDAATGSITPSTSNSGTFVITYIIKPIGGCAAYPVTTQVTISPLPNPILVDGTLCYDAIQNSTRNYEFDTKLDNTSHSFQWFFNSTLINGATQNTYTATTIGNYSVIATNILTGCISNQVFATVTSAQIANDFYTSINDNFIEKNILTVVVQGGSGPFLYQLNNGSFQTSNVFYQLPIGMHTITVTDNPNCTLLTKKVLIMGYPKFFTPNGDGYNENWNIYYFEDIPEAQIHIFDRYGKFLKQISPLGTGWNGTYNGKSMPSTDYWFTVDYKENNLKGEVEKRTFRAHFSLKR